MNDLTLGVFPLLDFPGLTRKHHFTRTESPESYSRAHFSFSSLLFSYFRHSVCYLSFTQSNVKSLQYHGLRLNTAEKRDLFSFQSRFLKAKRRLLILAVTKNSSVSGTFTDIRILSFSIPY